MPHQLIDFIVYYGYFALFILIFSQEMGIPNPVPNELVLMFSGYLSLNGALSFPIIILVTVFADLIGTMILYTIFYFFGLYILQRKWRWLPTSPEKINQLTKRISGGGIWIIYLGRLIPFIRGYTSVIVGLLHIRAKVFLPVAFISALTWSIVFVMIGRKVGPLLNPAGNNFEIVKVIVISSVLIILLVISLVRYFKKKSKKHF